MKYDIKFKPSYSMLVVTLEPDEKILAESGAMTYMTPNIEVHTRKRETSLLGTLGLAIFGHQSFWSTSILQETAQAKLDLSQRL
jgi:uncharacterized protein (AIM24 family)